MENHGTPYLDRREQLTTYFDKTATAAWSALTSDAPVSKIRQTVREGRDRMRTQLLSWLPEDMTGMRLLDAGCGTGALAIEAAERGAEVVGVDVSGRLIELAYSRAPDAVRERVTFQVGDMLDPSLGEFDYVVAMDSLIHYEADDIADMTARLAFRCRRGVLITFAPATALLSLMHMSGRLLPKSDRAPAIVPVSEGHLRDLLMDNPMLAHWSVSETHHVSSGFYKSRALRLTR